MPKRISRATKNTDSKYTARNPENGCWWRYLDPSELEIFQKKPKKYGLKNIPEAQRLLVMKGVKCQKMAPSKEFASQWECKAPGGKYLKVPLNRLNSNEYAIEPISGYGFILGDSIVREGKIESTQNSLVLPANKNKFPQIKVKPVKTRRKKMSRDLDDLWNDDAKRRRLSAFHESGHAAYVWHFSKRDIANPPFDYIQIGECPNEGGIVPGEVKPDPANISSDKNHYAAIKLAGLYAQHKAYRVSPEKWEEIVTSCEGSDAAQDIADARVISIEKKIPWPEYLALLLTILKSAKGIHILINAIARLLLASGNIDITNPELIRILNRYSIHRKSQL